MPHELIGPCTTTTTDGTVATPRTTADGTRQFATVASARQLFPQACAPCSVVSLFACEVQFMLCQREASRGVHRLGLGAIENAASTLGVRSTPVAAWAEFERGGHAGRLVFVGEIPELYEWGPEEDEEEA